jgi:NADPH:quinone reductase-like Zn-dependent oxidoreductase
VARHAGAEIYATAGSKEEIEHLHSSWNIPQNRVFSSKDVSFRAGILRETSGEGVDVVLSSLSCELAQASWDTVAEFGRHISIGSDIGDAARPNRSFHHVDWNRLQSTKPAIIQR